MKERANMERLFDKVLVTGGAGYCGARLVPQMLARGYKVTVYDIMFFGNQFLPRDNPNLRIIDGDIRDAAKFAAAVAGHDAVVNLACICVAGGSSVRGAVAERSCGHEREPIA
jgi:nucleoside-diphosphate-sugar epimerase